MILMQARENWHDVADQIAWCSAFVPMISAILYQLVGWLRDWQQRLMLRTIIRHTPCGSSVVCSSRRSAGTSWTITVKVGNGSPQRRCSSVSAPTSPRKMPSR